MWTAMGEGVRALLFPLVLLAVATCCLASNTSVESTKTALAVLSDDVDLASKLAFQGCVQREQVEVAAVKSGAQSTAEAREALAKVRKWCDDMHEVFELVRVTQHEAVELYERGDYDQAQEKINEVRTRFTDIRSKIGDAL